MLGFSAAAQFLSGPGQSYSVAAFNQPMQRALGISETSMSLAYGAATIISGIALPWTGRLIDRHGARIVLPVTAVFLAMACVGMSYVTNLPTLYVGFTFIRCLGQGAMWLVGTWIVGEWFLNKRGLATALSGLGSSVSVMTFPVLNLYLITHFGWQQAWQALGLVVVATIVLPAALFLRDRPEDLGLHPDGADEAPTVDPHKDNAPTMEAWTLGEVLRDATFWKLLSVGVCTGMIGTGLVFHQVTILGAHGISMRFALYLIPIQAFVGSIAALPAGWLTDRCRAEFLLGAAMAMLALAVLIVTYLPTFHFAYLYAVLVGLQGSILRCAGTVVWVNYYGRANQGVIRGAAMSAMILAAAVGPIPLAMSNDLLGTYTPSLVMFFALPLLSMLLVLTARQPTKPRSTG